MSIDHYIYVDNNPDYDVSTDFDGKKLHENTIYIIQAGIEYLHIYQDPARAAGDFEKWRREPLEDISLALNGVRQPGGRLPIEQTFINPESVIPVTTVNFPVEDAD